LQTGDVARAKKYIRSYKQTLTDLGASVSAKFPKGTVLMAIAANVGDVAISEFDAFCPDSVVGFVPSKKLDKEFLYYSLRSLRPNIATSSTSNAQDNTNIARLSTLRIPLPELSVQKCIVESLDHAETRNHALADSTSRSIDRLREFRSALITAAVTGQIDVTTWCKQGQTDRRLDEIEEAMQA
jgi:type I restriction enzyme S subunit